MERSNSLKRDEVRMPWMLWMPRMPMLRCLLCGGRKLGKEKHQNASVGNPGSEWGEVWGDRSGASPVQRPPRRMGAQGCWQLP